MKTIALISAIIIASALTESSQVTNAATAPKAAAEPKLSEINAAVCKIDLTNRTFRVIIWDGDTWKRDLPRTISWQDSTEIRYAFGTNHMTMAQFVGGAPLFYDICTNVSDLKGERATFYLERVDDKDVVRKMEVGIARFGHEVTIAVPQSGRSIIDAINQAAKPNKVRCDDGE